MASSEFKELWKEMMGYDLPDEEEEEGNFLQQLGSVGFDPEAAPFQRKEGQSMVGALGNAAGNFPTSLGNRFAELGAVIDDPIAAGKGILALGRGVGKRIIQDKEENRKDPDVNLARQAFGEFKESFSPEQLQEDPTAGIANAASILFPGIKGLQLASRGAGASRLAGALGKAAKVADIASDPAISSIRGAGKGAGAVARKSGRMGAKVGVETLGITTGREAGPVTEAFNAGFEGKKQRQAFLKAVDDKTISEDTVVKVGDLLRAEKKKLGDQVGVIRQQLRDNRQPIDIADVKREIFGDMGEEGLISEFGGQVKKTEPGREMTLSDPIDDPLQTRQVKVPDELDFLESSITAATSNVESARNAAQSALQRLFKSPDVVDANDLDLMKKALQDFTLTSSKEAPTLVHKASRILRKKLYDEVPGYAKAFSDYDELSSFLEDMKRRTNLNIDEPFTQSANAAFRSALNEDKDTAMRAVQALEERFGTKKLPIRAEIAGQALSRDVPSGIVGRSALIGAVGLLGTVGGAFLHPALFLSIAGLPAFFPAHVGRQMARLGAGARMAKETVETLDGMLKFAGANKIPISETMTIAQLVERITNDEQKPSSLLGKIGGPIPGQTVALENRKLNEPGLHLGNPFGTSR